MTLGLGSDGVPALVQLRTPPPALMGLPNLPVSLTGYSYVIMKLGPLAFTRKGLSVASTVACLTFTVSCFLHFCLYYLFTVVLGHLAKTMLWKLSETSSIFYASNFWEFGTFLWKVFQSASLCLTTTTPEQLAFALRWFMLPLRYIGVSVSEIVLTLLLSLRFINLVFDEVRRVRGLTYIQMCEFDKHSFDLSLFYKYK